MRYLITGGMGVIGSLIAHKLLDLGHSVVLVDPGENPRNRWIESQLLHREDIAGRVFIKRHPIQDCANDLIPEVDAVIHAGASTGIPYSVTAPTDDWEHNVNATLALMEAVRRTPRPTVVLSSIKPYRVDPLPPHGLDENTVLAPDEPYAASKAAQSMLTQAYAKSYGLPVVTFRCSNLYGPAPCHGPRHGWLTWFCISAAIRRPLDVQGTGEQTRDMLHANDVFSACMSALTRLSMDKALPEDGRIAGEVFNLGGGSENRISVDWAARRMNELTGVEIRMAPARAMDDLHVYVDTAKAQKRLGWTPQVSVLDGVHSTLLWAERHRPTLRILYEGI